MVVLNMSLLKEKYQKEVVPALVEQYKNALAVPRIVKVTVNVGFNPAARDEKAQADISRDLAAITGQKPNPRPARQAEAGFKIRKGMIVGLAVTLRGRRMYDFLDRLVHIALPRSRDFHGLSVSNVDQAGNLNMGIKEHIIFPEIAAEQAKNIFGLQITVATTAKDQAQGLDLFRRLGFPLRAS